MSVFAPAQEALLARLNRSLSALGVDVGSLNDAVGSLNDDLAGTQLSFLALLQALASLVVPAGAVCSFAGSSAPDGWLVCDGAAVSRTTYAALFEQIGTVFGAGDGVATFNLPDLRGEFVRGLDCGRGVDAARVLGTAQDWATGAPKAKSRAAKRLTVDGTLGIAFDAPLPDTPIGFARVGSASDPTGRTIASEGYMDASAHETDLLGVASGDPETRPRNVALLFCIKT